MYNTKTYKHYFQNWKLLYKWFLESNCIYWKYYFYCKWFISFFFISV